MSSHRSLPVIDLLAALLLTLLAIVPAPELAPALPEPLPAPRRIVVEVQSDGSIRLDGRAVEIGKLRAVLQQLAAASDTVVVRVPRNLDFRRFEQIRYIVEGIGNRAVRMRVLPP